MLRTSIDDFDANGQKGDWCFTKDDEYLVLRYGDTLDDTCVVALKPDGNRIIWQWDGNRESPTLSPSIRVFGNQEQPNKWHGFLQAGKIVEA